MSTDMNHPWIEPETADLRKYVDGQRNSKDYEADLALSVFKNDNRHTDNFGVFYMLFSPEFMINGKEWWS